MNTQKNTTPFIEVKNLTVHYTSEEKEIHAVNAHAQITAEQVRHPCEHAAERAENAAPVVHIEEDKKARTGDEDHHGLCPGGIAR